MFLKFERCHGNSSVGEVGGFHGPCWWRVCWKQPRLCGLVALPQVPLQGARVTVGEVKTAPVREGGREDRRGGVWSAPRVYRRCLINSGSLVEMVEAAYRRWLVIHSLGSEASQFVCAIKLWH